MQKVVYITYDGLTDPLGQSQVIPYVESLTAKGLEFTVMSYEKPERYERFGQAIADRLAHGNILWKPLRYHKRFSLLATSYDLINGFFHLLFAIPKKKIKVLHCRSYVSSILGLAFKKLYGTRFIFDMRGFWADERVEGQIIKKGFVYKVFKWLEEKFILNADATISLTQNAINEMATWPYMTPEAFGRIHHITTCCDIELYAGKKTRKPFRNETVTFLYVGSIGPWHSFDNIKSFIDFVYHYVPSSNFKMIVNSGRDDLQAHLRTMKYDLGRFTVTSLSHREIPAAIEDADIGFFFIPPVYAKKSSSPTKMGEMLAAGIPIITGHSIGDVDELVNKNGIGYVVKDFTAEEYKKAVDLVLSYLREDKEALAKRCLAVAEDYFSLKKGVDHYFDIYQELLIRKAKA